MPNRERQVALTFHAFSRTLNGSPPVLFTHVFTLTEVLLGLEQNKQFKMCQTSSSSQNMSWSQRYEDVGLKSTRNFTGVQEHAAWIEHNSQHQTQLSQLERLGLLLRRMWSKNLLAGMKSHMMWLHRRRGLLSQMNLVSHLNQTQWGNCCCSLRHR